jgi:site-specific DNA-methyltransferase (adenine-specific)
MTVDISGAGWRVFSGSCLDRLRELPDESVDAVVTDPPYGLSNTDPAHVSDALVRWVSGERDFIPEGKGFMGKAWDAFVPPPAVWDECLRVLKPGGHVLAFAGSRTFDLMALSIRLAGFEIRDSVAWLYGSGFPKSLDVSKAIDKAAGVEREVLTETVSDIFGEREEQKKKLDIASTHDRIAMGNGWRGEVIETIATTPEAQKWQGWGTALKPAFEPVVVARKPLGGRTVAENVLLHGTGGLNIDGTRIGTEQIVSRGGRSSSVVGDEREGASLGMYGAHPPLNTIHSGRWPSNVMLDEFTAGLVDEQSGDRPGMATQNSSTINIYGGNSFHASKTQMPEVRQGYNDTGGASRFFYVAKASKRDRNEGLDELPVQSSSNYGSIQERSSNPPKQNFHPTVKPTDLMRQLVRLVTPPGGVVLDPFTGSGSTGKAAILEGFEFIGVELTDEYLPIIEGRLSHAVAQRAQAEADAVAAEAETLF